VAEDPTVLLRIALVNESKKDWAAALSCLERAAAAAPSDEARARVAEAAARIEAAATLPSLRARAGTLARGATPTPASSVGPARPRTSRIAPKLPLSPKAPPQAPVLPQELEKARELLVTPDVVRALRDAFSLAGAKPAADAPLAVPVESILSRLLACDLDLARTIDLALDLVLEATGAARGFMIARDTHGRLELSRGRGLARESLPPALSTSILAEAERTGEPVFIADAATDAHFGTRESVQQLGLRSVACVPIVDETGPARELLGAVYLDDPRTSERFGPKARDLLRALARAIAPSLRNARRFEAQRAALVRARSAPDAQANGLARLVGSSKATKELQSILARVAPEDVPVLLEGESGTGKELAARVIHELSSRRAGPYVAENLGALPATLVEAELFGVTKGAFTGADRDRDGLFVRAKGGTVFLDEVGELPLEGQAKLLRVLQEKEVRPLGSQQPVKTDARVVAATNKDLTALVKEGRFREDLLYRLRVVAVRIPPLRERLEDIPTIAEAILARIAGERGEPVIPLSRGALARLSRREWRGNVRELENVLWRVALGGEAAIDEAATTRSETEDALGLTVTLKEEAVPLDEARLAFDRVYLNLVLARNGGNVARAARALGVTRPALSRILKRLGIERA
jgi:transcriptional regulator with GAF, ATPase, and Fis domain